MQSVVFVQDGRYVKQYLCQIFYRKYLEFFLKFFVYSIFIFSKFIICYNEIKYFKRMYDNICMGFIMFFILLGNIMLEFVY